MVLLTQDENLRFHAEYSINGFGPEPIRVELPDGSFAIALCFNKLGEPDATPTDPDYAATLAALAKRMGLPADYVDGIMAD